MWNIARLRPHLTLQTNQEALWQSMKTIVTTIPSLKKLHIWVEARHHRSELKLSYMKGGLLKPCCNSPRE